MGDEITKPQAAKLSCAALLSTYGSFFGDQAGYDQAIKKASEMFGKHEDSYWPGSVGGFQIANGDNALMVIRYWANYLNSQGFIVTDMQLVKLDEHGGLPPITDDDREWNDAYEDAVQSIREYHYEGGGSNANV